MTREEKIELLNKLLEIEEKGDVGNLTSTDRREFQQWVEELEQESILGKIKAEIEQIIGEHNLDDYSSVLSVPSFNEPMQVELEGDGYADGYLVYDYGKCPKCGWQFEEGDKDWREPFCCHCGQGLKWFEE